MGKYKGYDIYLETNEEMTAGSSYYEIVDKDLGIRYWIMRIWKQ